MKCKGCDNEVTSGACIGMIYGKLTNNSVVSLKQQIFCSDCLQKSVYYMAVHPVSDELITHSCCNWDTLQIADDPFLCMMCGSQGATRATVTRTYCKPPWLNVNGTVKVMYCVSMASSIKPANNHMSEIRINNLSVTYPTEYDISINVGRFSLLSSSEIKEVAMLCGPCHKRLGRVKCPKCKQWTADTKRVLTDGKCGYCLGVEGAGNDLTVPLWNTFVCPDCRNKGEGPRLPYGVRTHSRTYLYNIAAKGMNVNLKPCKCKYQRKSQGDCAVCGRSGKKYPDGVLGVCTDCAGRTERAKVKWHLPTFGSELELIGRSGRSESCQTCGGDGCYDCNYRDASNPTQRKATRDFNRIFGENGGVYNAGMDCSLSYGGVELRVGPLNRLHLPKFKKFLSAIQAYTFADRSCGGHIHLGVQWCDWETIRDFVKYGITWQSKVCELVPGRRRNYHFCHNIANTEGYRNIANATSEKDFIIAITADRYAYSEALLTMGKGKSANLDIPGTSRGGYVPFNRYNWMNLCPIFHKRTIEIRILEGTNKPERLIPWIKGWIYILDSLQNTKDRRKREELLATEPKTIFVDKFGMATWETT